MRLKLFRRQESSRAKEKTGDFREKQASLFFGNPQPFSCAHANRRAGKAGLPGSGGSSFHSLLRCIAWEIYFATSEMDGARGGSSSPAGLGAAPQRSPNPGREQYILTDLGGTASFRLSGGGSPLQGRGGCSACVAKQQRACLAGGFKKRHAWRNSPCRFFRWL